MAEVGDDRDVMIRPPTFRNKAIFFLCPLIGIENFSVEIVFLPPVFIVAFIYMV